jgi:tRNA modification GTPase
VIDVEDTIVAIASPTAPAPRGIVRMSGQDVVKILSKLGIEIPGGRRARRFDAQLDVGDPIGILPVSVMLWPTDRSYTGQPSAEFHTFGSLPVLTAIVEATAGAGARAARPGEFTMRAFLAGRLDLTQAEAVLGVIEAEKRGSLDHALRQLAGNLSRPLEQMRSAVLDLLADVEAGLDFVDEDIEFISDEALIDRLAEIRQQLDSICSVMQSRSGGAARPIVALRGEPNAGKSCLINRLAGKQVAIVAEQAGTTRDAVTTEAVIDGRSVTLVDTAGIEEAGSEVSRQSQVQAERASKEASVRLWCVDSSRDDFARACDQARCAADANRHPRVIDLWVATKSDLPASSANHPNWITCSSVTEDGMETLERSIAGALARQDHEETGSVVGTAARCGQSLSRAREAVTAAIELTQNCEGHEFVSAELRSVAQCLGEVTGAVYTDDILDRVFERFCIGK